jgi:hypothetical protein
MMSNKLGVQGIEWKCHTSMRVDIRTQGNDNKLQVHTDPSVRCNPVGLELTFKVLVVV